MNGYVCFYGGKRIELHAESLLAAKKAAIKQFKPPRSREHLVTVVLAEVNGKPVIHTPDF